MTTIVTLAPVWINATDDPSVSLFLRNTSGLNRTKSVDGRFQRTAAGRTRLIRTPGKSDAWSVEVFELTNDDEDWLTDHLGATLCFRDDRGNKIFGTYLTLPFEEITFPKRLSNSTLAISSITFSEGV